MIAELRLKNNIAGNSALEMLLFTPLALLFLFVAVDGGLAYTERAAVHDALRAGIAGHTREAQGTTYINDPTSDSGASLNNDNVQNIANDVLNETFLQLQRTQAVADDIADSRFRVDVLAAELDFNSTDGTLQSDTPRVIYQNSRGSFDIQQLSSEANLAAPLEQLSANLHPQLTMTPSPYALPLTPTYDAQGTLNTDSFFPHSVVIFVQISAVPRGLHPEVTNSMIGKFFALQDSEVFIVRRQLG